MTKNKCIVSYTYDDEKHEKWVVRLIDKLKIEYPQIMIDKYDLHLADDIDKYMDHFYEADKIILICTPNYLKKETGGAGYEKSIISQIYKKDTKANKFIILLKSGTKDTAIPTYLRNKKYIDLTDGRITKNKRCEIINAIKENENMDLKSINKAKKNQQEIVQPLDVYADQLKIKLVGYSLLGGRGQDGIRYLWKDNLGNTTESAAFNSRIKTPLAGEDQTKTSAYTSSVSYGCNLQNMNCACKFCATGTLPFKGVLTASEIALQNIFMAEYDSECPSYPNVHTNSREFAFMGQGEPGYCYPQIRKAILLTDYAMDQIGQKVKRYIISSSGIPEFIDLLIDDLKNGIYKNDVTFHFSLHAIDELRDRLMPINKVYNYKYTLQKTKILYDISKRKTAIAILLFKDFKEKKSSLKHDTSIEYLNRILDILDPKIHKIDLCDVNINKSISKQSQLSNEIANKLLEVVKEKGFEAKLFSSFGIENSTGCGMLSSNMINIQKPGKTTLKHLEKSIELLKKAQENIY